MTISVISIVKNEEHNMKEFLRTLVGLADELTIVDTGSTDTTVALIHQWMPLSPYKVRFLERQFTPFHFGKAKNFAIERARGDYIASLDADERVSELFKKSLKKKILSRPRVLLTNRVDELVPHYVDPQTKIFQNFQGIKYGEDDHSRVDETLYFEGNPTPFPHPILHKQGINHLLLRPSRQRAQLEIDVDRTPRTRSRAREIVRGFFTFYYIFKKIYVGRQSYKDGWLGFKYSVLRAWYKFLVHFHVAFKHRGVEISD